MIKMWLWSPVSTNTSCLGGPGLKFDLKTDHPESCRGLPHYVQAYSEIFRIRPRPRHSESIPIHSSVIIPSGDAVHCPRLMSAPLTWTP
jgi:hypothetical protein